MRRDLSRVCGHRGGAGDLQPAQQHGKAASCKPGPQLFPRGTVRLSSSGVCLLLFPRSAAASQAFCAAKPCRRADSFRPEENEIRVPCPALAGQGIKAASCKPGPQLLPRGTVKLSPSAQTGRARRGASRLFSQGTRHMGIAKVPPYRPSQSPSVKALPEGEPGP